MEKVFARAAPGVLVDVGGRQLHAMIRGAGSPTVVIESGGGGGTSVQDLPVQELIAQFTRCICYDRAGLGWSDPDPDRRTLQAMADDLAAMLAALGEAAPLVLVAGSFGGLVARTFARRHPDLIGGMVLVDAAEEQMYFATMPRFRDSLRQALAEAATRAATGELSKEAVHAGRLPRSLTATTKSALLAVLDRPEHFHNSIRELEVLADAPPAAGGSDPLGPGDFPLILLTHTKPYEGAYALWEEGWRDAQQRLSALSTRSALIAAADCGHSISVENPKLVAACAKAVVDCVRNGDFDFSEVEVLASQGPDAPEIA